MEMFEKARGRKPQDVQQAWEDMKAMGAPGGCAKVKCDTLLSFLSNQGKELMNDKWVEVLMSFREEISKWREARRIGRKMYWGELERIHGRKEFTEFIRMGKYKATTGYSAKSERCP